MRLIDADELLTDPYFMDETIPERVMFIEAVEDSMTIDAVPVVRCKDCKHWNKGDFMGGDTPDSLEYGGGCPLVRFARYESDFCSKGERKEDDGNG